jgi:hypothetical protein
MPELKVQGLLKDFLMISDRKAYVAKCKEMDKFQYPVDLKLIPHVSGKAKVRVSSETNTFCSKIAKHFPNVERSFEK